MCEQQRAPTLVQVYSGTREKKAHSAVTVHESLCSVRARNAGMLCTLQDELTSARATCDEHASALADLTLRAARAEAAATDALERLASASADGLVVSDALTVRCGIRCEPMHCIAASEPYASLCSVWRSCDTKSRAQRPIASAAARRWSSCSRCSRMRCDLFRLVHAGMWRSCTGSSRSRMRDRPIAAMCFVMCLFVCSCWRQRKWPPRATWMQTRNGSASTRPQHRPSSR